MANNYPQFVAEMTVLSTENLKKPSFTLLPRRRLLRPFISFISTSNGNNSHKGDNQKYYTFGDHCYVPIEANFFTNIHSCIYVQLHTKSLLGRRVQLGCCRIPAADIGAIQVGSLRHLSYKVWAKDKSHGHGIVNLKLKLDNYGSQVHSCQEVIDLPIQMLPPGD
ncbi:hypothetical protein CCACVL1_13669 [Corchorus capsularis]|uniref:Uncharacterized protein n=1 Tax=Corchorus capsularis TaxID=210143 RepID=A0A1R3IA45_COCAP|nr:hypothetical protein CCACVL1_13669 [Corchorus capsularis]